MGIALGATFFMALQYAAEVAWSVAVKRVYEAVSSYLPAASVVILIILLAGQFQLNHLYHWMDPETINPDSPHYDEVIDNKHGYFGANNWFFWLRTIIYLGVWNMFQRGFIKRSIEQDLQGGTKIHYKTMSKAAGFLVFFAVTSSTEIGRAHV